MNIINKNNTSYKFGAQAFNPTPSHFSCFAYYKSYYSSAFSNSKLIINSTEENLIFTKGKAVLLLPH